MIADLHIHTALSPCASDKMTPGTIVEKSIKAGLKTIAITDHNSCFNVNAVQEAAKGYPLLVIPGVEVQTEEEIHTICIFPKNTNCINFCRILYNFLPAIPNNESFFGKQLIFNNCGGIKGKEKKLLLNSAAISLDKLFCLVHANEGYCIPAHIDKQSFSLLSNLGAIPVLDYLAFEVFFKKNITALQRKHSTLKQYPLICSSDAHHPQEIGTKKTLIKAEENSFQGVVSALKRGQVSLL